MSHPPTPEQAEIISSIRSPSGGSTMVEAGAGCAKTTTLEMAAKHVLVPALALAFNKRIAQEMSSRLPGNYTVKTMNSLGHAAWLRAIGTSPKLDDRKSGKLITQIAKHRRLDLTSDQWDAARSLFREAQIQGLVPASEDRLSSSLIPDTPEGWASLLDTASTDIDSEDFSLIWEITREALTENIKLAREGVISFDDQIYCSTLLGGQFGRFPVIFLDEDQDLNPLQIHMLRQSMRPDTRVLAVGDRQQSIYAFRGAVGEAAEQIRALRPFTSWTDLPLMTSFRVPQLIATRQRQHVPLFRAHGANPIGFIRSFSPQEGWSWPDILSTIPEPSSEIAILCRNNAPILALAFKLIRQSVPCYVLGRDISRGLVSLTRKLAPSDDVPVSILLDRLQEWTTSEISKAQANDNLDAISRISDRSECIIAIIDGTQAPDAGTLRRSIQHLFSRESGLVCLSTIHRAKGLEWPTVIHLDPWRLPSKFARSPRAIQQEANLRYVCETRTKHTLIHANLEDFH